MKYIYIAIISSCCSGVLAAQSNSALSFDGQTAYGDTSVGWAPVQNATYECWVKIDNYDSAQNEMKWILGRWGWWDTGMPAFNPATGEATGIIGIGHQEVTPPGTVQQGTWHHLATVTDGNASPGFDLYLDGVLILSEGPSPYTPGSTWTMCLGAMNYLGWDGFYLGEIDEARISTSRRYTTNFTPEREFVADVFTYGLWHFDEGSGSVAYDESGNGYDFNMHGNYQWVTGNDSGAPVAENDSAAVDEDSIVSIDVMSNDINAAYIDSVTLPSNGVATVNGSMIDYLPNQDWNGVDTFTYTVSDGTAVSAAATVTVTVNPINDAPIADGATIAIDEDTVLSVDLADFASDIDGDPLSFSVCDVTNGTADIIGSALSFTPSPDFNGLAAICVVVSDGIEAVTFYFDIAVAPVNDSPVASGGSLAINEDEVGYIDLSNLATDVDANVLTYAASGGTHGTVDVVGSVATYTPDENFFGSDVFAYTASDGIDTASASVSVTVAPINDAPIAVADAALSMYSAPIDVNVLANDIDIDSSLDPSSVTILIAPQYGLAIVNSDGTIHVEPYLGYTGEMFLTYRMADLDGAQSNEAVLHIGVGPRAPQAMSDALNTTFDTASSLMLTANDIDPDGDLNETSLTISQMPAYGVVVNNGDGSVTYSPYSGHSGSDVFSYFVFDDTGLQSNTATVQVDVSGSSNTIPTAVYDSHIITLGESLVINVLSNDWDADNDALDPHSVLIEGNPAKGTAAVDPASGLVEYTADNGVVGTTDTFTYSVQDVRGGRSNIATVQIEIPQDIDPSSDLPSFNMSLGYLAAGQKSALLLSDADANAHIDIIWCNAVGSMQTQYGTMGLAGNFRMLGSTYADSNGDATLDFLVPPSAQGMTLYFQALDRSAARLSAVASGSVN